MSHVVGHVPDYVHYAAEPCEADTIGAPEGYVFRAGWYFWTETLADRVGPFETEPAAREAMGHYVETLSVKPDPEQ